MGLCALGTTGWEHGLLFFQDHSNVTFRSASCSCTTSLHTRTSIQSSTVRSGQYALKLAHSASNDYWYNSNGIVTDMSARVYHRVSAVSGNDGMVISINQTAGFLRAYGIGIRPSTGCYHAFVSVSGGVGLKWGAAGPAVSTNKWTRLEFRTIKTGGVPDTHTTEGFVDGTALPSVSDTTLDPTSSVEYVTLGNNASYGGTGTYDEYFDDLIWFANDPAAGTQPPWPIGHGQVELLTITGEGTHNTASVFTDSNGNTPPVSPQLLIDEVPATDTDTDYIYQNAVDANAYLEFTLSNMVSQQTPRGVWIGINQEVQLDGPDFVDFSYTSLKLIDGAFVTATSAPVGSIGGDRGGIGGPARARQSVGDPGWTTALADAFLLRVGYSASTVAAIMRIHSIYIEVETAGTVAGIGSWQIVG